LWKTNDHLSHKGTLSPVIHHNSQVIHKPDLSITWDKPILLTMMEK